MDPTHSKTANTFISLVQPQLAKRRALCIIKSCLALRVASTIHLSRMSPLKEKFLIKQTKVTDLGKSMGNPLYLIANTGKDKQTSK